MPTPIGFFVLSAANGVDALKQVERQPDIILLDINMPEDGLEVCRRIRDYISIDKKRHSL